MKIINVNEAQVRRNLTKLGKRARYAGMNALNATAFRARADVQYRMRQVFDRPTPYVLNAVRVGRAYTDYLTATVYLRYPGGKGVDPNKVLEAEIEGGSRRAKRMEVALQRKGLLWPGWYCVPAKGIPPDKIDAYGNVKGSFIVQILSVLQAFSEQGYSANATPRSLKRLAKRGKTERGYAIINGVEYFISRGPGNWFGRGAWKHGQTQRLPPGIWARSGLHGMHIRPIFAFVRSTHYNKRLDFYGAVLDTARLYLVPALRYQLDKEFSRPINAN